MTVVLNVTDLAVGPRCHRPDDGEIDQEDEVATVAIVDVEILVIENGVRE